MQYKWNLSCNATNMRPSVLHCSSDSIYIALCAQIHLYCIAGPNPFILHCASNSIYIALQWKYVYAMCLTHMSQLMEQSEVSETLWDLVRWWHLVRSGSFFEECFEKMDNASNFYLVNFWCVLHFPETFTKKWPRTHQTHQTHQIAEGLKVPSLDSRIDWVSNLCSRIGPE